MVNKKWVDLLDFPAECEAKGNELYEFFCTLICLLSDLCLDRNFLAIEPLAEMYSYELCYELITNTNYDYQLRHAFTKLITTLWVDKDFMPIVLPNRVRIWSKIEENKKMIPSKNAVQDYKNLKDFIRNYIKEITYGGSIQVPF